VLLKQGLQDVVERVELVGLILLEEFGVLLVPENPGTELMGPLQALYDVLRRNSEGQRVEEIPLSRLLRSDLMVARKEARRGTRDRKREETERGDSKEVLQANVFKLVELQELFRIVKHGMERTDYVMKRAFEL